MANSVTVSYGRKRTDKLGDGSFDAVELGGILTVETDENPLEIYNAIFKALSKEIDGDFSSIPKNDLAVIKAIPQQRAPEPENGPTAEPQRMDEPVKREPLGWLKDTVDKNTAQIQDRIQAMPGEHISGGGGTIDEYGTPPTSSIRPNEAVMFSGVRVFEAKIATASNGNEYGTLRVGKRGRDGIPGQYTTARSFEPGIVDAIKRIREGDMVDVYGYFKPWKQNPDKFDLELQKVERSE